VVCSCEHSNELLDAITLGNFLLPQERQYFIISVSSVFWMSMNVCSVL
jgi:hypothetical protein